MAVTRHKGNRFNGTMADIASFVGAGPFPSITASPLTRNGAGAKFIVADATTGTPQEFTVVLRPYVPAVVAPPTPAVPATLAVVVTSTVP